VQAGVAPAGAQLVELANAYGNNMFALGNDGETKICALGGTQKLGFYGHPTTAQQTGVAVDAAAIHAALVTLGLITA
jgi:hypothetical protein